MRNYFVLLTLLSFLYSCKITEDFSEHRPEPLTETFPWSEYNIDTSTMANMTIDEFFKDSLLLNLIETGLENNYSLAMAMQAMDIANAYYLQGKAAYLPNVDATLQPSFLKNSNNSQFGSFLGGNKIVQSYQLGVSASWEADIWGKLKAQESSYLADYLGVEASVKWAQTTLISNIASLYFQLIALDEQKKITERTIQNRKKSIETIQALKDAGLVTEVAVKQTEAQLYQSQAILVDLNKEIQLNENTLNALLSRPYQVIERSEIDQIDLPIALTIGIPAQLLENRPDLKMSEYNIRSTFELTNVARSYFYPSLNLTASTGFESLDIAKLLSPNSIFANLAAGLTQPLANKRVNKTRLEVSELQYQQAILDYENQYIYAVKEVLDALTNADAADEKRNYQAMELQALSEASEYSTELLNYGLANYLEVLTAQNQELSAELNIVSSQLNKWSAVISLYKALGGGW
ncbi:efflux transporter outer membrane subunit [Membranihabitans marinus]|uniref:efflux transporter outer membrane subunit n=1 Tax=Membranihabitans marinus TaxID=1227546 RepID=UPI001F005CC3|nr:efflux transporter outer membrane subunit [Membranihabitans marinus]